MELLDPYLYSGDEGDEDFQLEPDLIVPKSRGDMSGGAIGTPAEILLARRFIVDIREKLDSLEKVVARGNTLNADDVERLLLRSPKPRAPQGKVIEGVFDGENMLGADGKQYTVPSNYASKSKLVEGDILKLTITDDGSFVFKQIGPIERLRVIGSLVQDELTGDYIVVGEGKKWNVLLASVTFFRAEPGDDLVILVPKNAPSRWAAVENVIKNLQVPLRDADDADDA